MAEDRNFVEIGDHRDIPMALGLVAIVWNSCELGLREVIKVLATRQVVENQRAVEVLISELGTVGLTQAIRCYAAEFPDSETELPGALIYIADTTERLKSYRNYYFHGIRGITQYGLEITDEMIDRDTPITDAMIEGPFAHIYQRSAKGRSKFVTEFVGARKLMWLNNELADLNDYIRGTAVSLRYYLNGDDYRQIAPLLEQRPLPDVLAKPELRHPKLKPRPAPTPRDPRKIDNE